MKTIILAALIALPVMAQTKKADAPKEPAKAAAAPQTKQLSPSQLYAIQKASEDVQRAQEALKAAQQTMSAVGMSIQQDCGCRITQENGKLVGIVEPAPAKK